MMKMSNFENPTWRTAAILKIVIAPYLSRKSSEYHEILYADTNGDGNDKKSRNWQIQNGGWTPH